MLNGLGQREVVFRAVAEWWLIGILFRLLGFFGPFIPQITLFIRGDTAVVGQVIR